MGPTSDHDGGSENVFYFDLGSPHCWLAAEELARVVIPGLSWVPVLERALALDAGFVGWARSDAREFGQREVEDAAASIGCRVRWPWPWPPDVSRVMRVAAYALTRSRSREFALAAFRVQFCDGQPLSEWHAISQAVVRAGLRGGEALDAPLLPAYRNVLAKTTEQALAAGVSTLPTCVIAGERLIGHESLRGAVAGLVPD